jgi:hypothetical protein
MADEKIVVMERGKENRTLSWGVTPESKAYVRETSGGGDLIEMMFDAAERETTVTFEHAARFGKAGREEPSLAPPPAAPPYQRERCSPRVMSPAATSAMACCFSDAVSWMMLSS